MPLRFQYYGYNWTVREGFPPMGSDERTDPSFVDALRATHPRLTRMTSHELASWTVARLNYLVSGALPMEGAEFAHDTNEFGYKLKITDASNTSRAHGAIVIHADRMYFASVDVKYGNFQDLVVQLLADSPEDLAECEIRVREPETKRYRKYGWDGYALLK